MTLGGLVDAGKLGVWRRGGAVIGSKLEVCFTPALGSGTFHNTLVQGVERKHCRLSHTDL